MSLLSIFKPIGEEITLTLAVTVDNAKLVRIANDTANAVLITVKDTEGETYSSFTLLGGTEHLVQKAPPYTIEANSAVKAVKASF